MHRRHWLFITLVLALCSALPAPLWATADEAYAAARQLLKVRQDQQAANELQKFLTTYPNDPRVHEVGFMLGRIYQRQGAYDKALAAFSKVIDKATDKSLTRLRAETHFQMGECYLSQKNYARAEQSYLNSLVLDTGVPDLAARAHYWRGECLYQLGRLDDALKVYQRVPAVDPKHSLVPWSYYSQGVIYLHQEDYSKGIAALEQVTTKYKDSEVAGEATLTLGLAYMARAQKTPAANAKGREDDFNHAITTFTAALAGEKIADTARQRALLAMTEAYFELKKYDKAEETCAKALTTVKLDNELTTRTHLWRGHAFFNGGRFREAVTEYGIVTASKNADMAAEAQYWLAKSLYEVAEKSKQDKDYLEAADAFQRFMTRAGDKHALAPSAMLLMAFSLELGMGDSADVRMKAIAAYTALKDKWPSSREAAQAIGGILRIANGMKGTELAALANKLPAGAAQWNVALQLAREQFQAEKYELASASARKVLDGKPTGELLAQAAYLLAASQQKMGKGEEAITNYKQVLGNVAAGSELATYANRGLMQAYFEAKKYPEARDAALVLQKVTLEESEQVLVLMYLAESYAGNKQMPEALATFRALVADHPKSTLVPNALMRIAWIAETQKDWPAAITAYRSLVADYPDHELVPEAFYHLGVDLGQQKDTPGAIAAFNNVPKSYKMADQAAYAIAWLYKENQEIEKANEQFAKVAEQFPESPLAADSLFRIGEYYLDQKKFSEAMRLYSRAADKVGQSTLAPLVYYKLGVCAYRSATRPEDYSVAANAFGKVAGNFPTSTYAAESLFWRGQSLEAQNLPDAAVEAYQQYLAKFATGALSLDAALGAGRAMLMAKKYPAARTQLQKTQQLCLDAQRGSSKAMQERAKSVLPETQYDIAQSYYEEKNYQEALSKFAGVVAYPLEPWYSRSMLMMARCSLTLGDRQAAQSSLQLLVNNFPKSEAAQQGLALAKESKLEVTLPPAMEAPKPDAPKTDAPKVDAPKLDAPTPMEPPAAEAPAITNAPKADAPATADAPKADTPAAADTPKAE